MTLIFWNIVNDNIILHALQLQKRLSFSVATSIVN